MNQNNMHMVPQVIIDCAENIFKAPNNNIKNTYVSRMEVIRDYCDNILKRAAQPDQSRDVLRKFKAQLNYSRIDRNKV